MSERSPQTGGLMTRNTCDEEGCTAVWYSLDPADYCDRHQAQREELARRKAEEAKLEGLTREEIFQATHGDGYPAFRRAVLRQCAWRCVDCGLTDAEHKARDDLWPPGKGLHTHHIIAASRFIPVSDGHTPLNGVALCADCHRAREAGSRISPFHRSL